MVERDDGVAEEVGRVEAGGQDELGVSVDVLGADAGFVGAGGFRGSGIRGWDGEAFEFGVVEGAAQAVEVEGLRVGAGDAERAGRVAVDGEEVGHGGNLSRGRVDTREIVALALISVEG